MTTADDEARYLAAAHGMQTGVAYEQEHDSSDGSPKQLRVGVNSAMCDHAALVRLLVDAGVITREQYIKAIADEMERERDRYEERINNRYGTGSVIHLG